MDDVSTDELLTVLHQVNEALAAHRVDLAVRHLSVAIKCVENLRREKVS